MSDDLKKVKMSVFWRVADLSNITRIKELKLVPLMPGPSPEPDVLDCDNSCVSREDPNIQCSVSSTATPSTPLPALAWNRRYTDWRNKPSDRVNPANECKGSTGGGISRRWGLNQMRTSPRPPILAKDATLDSLRERLAASTSLKRRTTGKTTWLPFAFALCISMLKLYCCQ